MLEGRDVWVVQVLEYMCFFKEQIDLLVIQPNPLNDLDSNPFISPHVSSFKNRTERAFSEQPVKRIEPLVLVSIL